MITNTIRIGWNPQNRAAVAFGADDTALTATTSKLANIPTHAYHPDKTQNAIEIAWTMEANGQSCNCYLYAARYNGDITLAWTGTLTTGTQVATDSRLYVDTLSTTTDTWINTIKEVDAGGGNGMARIVFDTFGYTSFFCLFDTISAGSVKAIFSGY